jgi:hypothetical protein
MSSLVAKYVDTIGSLTRREPVQVRLPNGSVVTAVPEEICIGGDKTIMQLHVQIEGPTGPIEAQIRMSHETYEKSLVKARDMTPRFEAAQRRLQLRAAR